MIVQNFNMVLGSDKDMAVGLVPATAIGGWGLECVVWERWLANSGLIQKSCASGFGGSGNLSGITVTSSGTGQFTIYFNPQDTSGVDPGAYVYQISRTDSGYVTPLVQGNFLLRPGN